MEMKLTGFLSDENDVPKWLQECSEKIIDYMNADHRNSLSASLKSLYEIQDKEGKMVKLEVHDYQIKSEENIFAIPFSRGCNSRKEYKLELIKHSKLYKSFEV